MDTHTHTHKIGLKTNVHMNANGNYFIPSLIHSLPLDSSEGDLVMVLPLEMYTINRTAYHNLYIAFDQVNSSKKQFEKPDQRKISVKSRIIHIYSLPNRKGRAWDTEIITLTHTHKHEKKNRTHEQSWRDVIIWYVQFRSFMTANNWPIIMAV